MGSCSRRLLLGEIFGVDDGGLSGSWVFGYSRLPTNLPTLHGFWVGGSPVQFLFFRMGVLDGGL